MASPVGERIRLRRQALGMTQEELAARVGASPSAVLGWEKGRYFPARKQGALEAVLGISLTGDEEARPYPDPAEPAEVALWGLTRFSEQDRRVFIDAVRKAEPRRELAG